MLELKTIAVREDGCFSVGLWNGRPLFVTVERTFDDGKPILQNGEYECVASHYIKGNYDTYEIIVAGHSRVLFHKGNTELNSLACVVIGNAFDIWKEMTVVIDSKEGFRKFIEATTGLQKFTMQVTGR